MNPYDWISLFNIVAKDVVKYEPIHQFFRSMIRAYILEVAKMDIEIASVLRRKPILKPLPPQANLEKFKSSFIEKDHWGVTYKMKENEIVLHCMMFLIDKHLFSTSTLNQILAKDEVKKSNNEGDVKCVSNMIKWWIVIQMTVFKTIPKVFKVEKKEQEKTTTTT
ncbi:unnamed protein product [Lactuca saligna]|uniref:Uncharacterized protein n=1 Tax=Lactuca saligna TaxID=75948 RepID=A0AA35ZKJ5_LACSI|nr:unnamed protein product [Lactuca saligna]